MRGTRSCGAAVAIALGWAAAFRLPTSQAFHQKLVWIAAWLAPVRLVASGAFPDFTALRLHVLFIGGTLMAFSSRDAS